MSNGTKYPTAQNQYKSQDGLYYNGYMGSYDHVVDVLKGINPLKFKGLDPLAFLPTRAHTDDAGLDIYAIDNGTVNREFDYIEYRTGLAVEIPTGWVGLLFPRSSISKYPLALANAVGVVDSSYRGEILLRFKYIGEGPNRYKQGDRVGQLVLMQAPPFTPEWSDILSESIRGAGSYGSSGA